MLKLGVNVDHVATVRQARLPLPVRQAGAGRQAAAIDYSVYPDPVEAAKVAVAAGAHSVVMHLREDRRHVQDDDVIRARRELKGKFNLEMSIAPDIVRVARTVLPDQATLVPERRRERTTEGGLDLTKKTAALRRAIDALRSKKISVSLFIDPDLRQVEQAKKLGVDAVEFHTGDYANQKSVRDRKGEFDRLKSAVAVARQMGLVAHAGHGLDYANVGMLKSIPGIDELNIGYSIVTRAVWVGLDRAVREMIEAIS